MKKNLIVFLILFLPMVGLADEYEDLIARRDMLKQQIDATNSELLRCEKTLKAWKIATIIGGIGTVATGIGAIVQNNQVQENKQELQKNYDESKEAGKFLDYIKDVNK